MIVSITKIKGLGLVFRDYKRPKSLPNFKNANLIYGWNGCGKTTFSRLFDAISASPVQGIEYEIEGENARKFRENDDFPQKIRVFNQDYVQKNVKVLDSRASSISIVLGEENQELSDLIQDNEKKLNGDPENPEDPGRIAEHRSTTLKVQQTKKNYDEKFTEIAKTIGVAIGGNALRTYKRQQAQSDFNNLKNKSELTPGELTKNLQAAKQESVPVIDEVSAPIIIHEGKEVGAVSCMEQLEKVCDDLLSQTVNVKAVKRLVNNPDISSWVEAGIKLHKDHASKACEYCGQSIPVNRVRELADHFNEADRELKADIDTQLDIIESLSSAVNGATLPDRSRLYPNLQKDYEREVMTFIKARSNLSKSLEQLKQELKDKKARTTEKQKAVASIDPLQLKSSLEQINATIKKHNSTTEDFTTIKTEAEKKLKSHYLSTIYDEVLELGQQEKDAKDRTELINQEIKDIQKETAEAVAQISSDHKACERINEKLTMFLGHNELQFKPHIEKEIGEDGNEIEVSSGYDILRGTSLAKDLSEGEKTAIAFVYFVVHLGDKEFKVEDGIVVIDDPVSSLDSNSLYQAFSFLKNSVINAEQCFILTHNFDFLKLLLNWQKNNNHGKHCGFFMIKNTFDEENNRNAVIELMDKELKDYESEYHYLFKTLKDLRDAHDDTIARAYPIPNIARKVWDTFTMFSVPNGASPYLKIVALKEAGYDEAKLDAIYKFINDQSHITGSGFDPALVVGAKRAVADMLDMMKLISPDHFKYIDESTRG